MTEDNTQKGNYVIYKINCAFHKIFFFKKRKRENQPICATLRIYDHLLVVASLNSIIVWANCALYLCTLWHKMLGKRKNNNFTSCFLCFVIQYFFCAHFSISWKAQQLQSASMERERWGERYWLPMKHWQMYCFCLGTFPICCFYSSTEALLCHSQPCPRSLVGFTSLLPFKYIPRFKHCFP